MSTSETRPATDRKRAKGTSPRRSAHQPAAAKTVTSKVAVVGAKPARSSSASRKRPAAPAHDWRATFQRILEDVAALAVVEVICKVANDIWNRIWKEKAESKDDVTKKDLEVPEPKPKRDTTGVPLPVLNPRAQTEKKP